jgi:hypothetical protein
MDSKIRVWWNNSDIKRQYIFARLGRGDEWDVRKYLKYPYWAEKWDGLSYLMLIFIYSVA